MLDLRNLSLLYRYFYFQVFGNRDIMLIDWWPWVRPKSSCVFSELN